jgi:hypothetical protein
MLPLRRYLAGDDEESGRRMTSMWPAPAAGTTARVVLAVATVLWVAACAGAAPEPAPSASAGGAPPPSAPTPTPSTSTPPPSPSPGGGEGLAGEPIDFFFAEGDTLAVVGVAHDDVLNVRAGPGVASDIVATLPPLTDDVVAAGAARQLPQSIWAQIGTDGVTGWANAGYLAYVGETTDETAAVLADLGGDRTAGSMLALGHAVARTRASSEPASDIVVVDGPTVDDLGEVTIDVIGLGDDAARGLRLHVFGQPIDTGAGFELRSAEQTVLCGRGVSGDGRCV